jgi:hypothetical protein
MAAEENDVNILPLPLSIEPEQEVDDGETTLTNDQVFVHTHVEIEDRVSSTHPEATDRQSDKRIDSIASPAEVGPGNLTHEYNDPSSSKFDDPSAHSSQEIVRVDGQAQDIFSFYQLKIDVPPCLYKTLGDFTAVRKDQSEALHKFIFANWPVLKTKKMQFKIGVD